MSCERFNLGQCGDCKLAARVADNLGAAYQEVYAMGATRQLGARETLRMLNEAEDAITDCPRQDLPDDAVSEHVSDSPDHCCNQEVLEPFDRPVALLAEAIIGRLLNASDLQINESN